MTNAEHHPFPLTRVCGIYRFENIETGQNYVGSSVNVMRRFREHVADSKRGSNRRIHRAIREHGLSSFRFGLVEPCGRDQLLKREQHYIRLYKGASVHGYNTNSYPTNPGFGHFVSDATRARHAAGRLGKKHSAETKELLRKINTGKRPSAESIAKQSAALRGRIPSDEHRRNLSAASIGKKKPSETIWRYRMTRLFQNPANEACARLGRTVEVRRSKEHCKSLSEASTRRYARARAEKLIREALAVEAIRDLTAYFEEEADQ